MSFSQAFWFFGQSCTFLCPFIKCLHSEHRGGALCDNELDSTALAACSWASTSNTEKSFKNIKIVLLEVWFCCKWKIALC